MYPLLQRFEFSYADGEQFWDRSGQLAFRLRKMMPDLRVTGSAADQRDFVDDAARRELKFGISLAVIGSTAPPIDEQFIPLAAAFLRELVLTFEVQWIRRFAFRQVAGRRCTTREEAETLFWQMIGAEGQEQLQALAPGAQHHALQTEFRQGPTEVMMRFAVLDLPAVPEAPADSHPHFVMIQEVTGTEPIAAGAFDAEAFMRNVVARQTQHIHDRMGPASNEQPDTHS